MKYGNILKMSKFKHTKTYTHFHVKMERSFFMRRKTGYKENFPVAIVSGKQGNIHSLTERKWEIKVTTIVSFVANFKKGKEVNNTVMLSMTVSTVDALRYTNTCRYLDEFKGLCHCAYTFFTGFGSREEYAWAQGDQFFVDTDLSHDRHVIQ